MSILNLECNTNRKNEEITIDLNEWQIHKAKLEEIRPWLENVEIKINTDYGKPISLQLANDWLKNAQVCIDLKTKFLILLFVNFFLITRKSIQSVRKELKTSKR